MTSYDTMMDMFQAVHEYLDELAYYLRDYL